MNDLLRVVFIFALIIGVYAFYKPNILESYTNQLRNNNIVGPEVYKRSTDLDYASVRWGLEVSEKDKLHQSQVAPILNPQSYYPRCNLWGQAVAAQRTNRIPDKWSNMKVYNHPVDSFVR